MKTKELIRRIELMGYGAQDIKSMGEVRVFHDEYECATAYTDEFLSLDTHHFMFDELVESEREALYNLLDEYARTPVEDREDREEEKKYYYRFPYYIAATELESPAYVCRNHTSRYFSSELILDTSSFDVVKKSDLFHFTDKEVEAMMDEDKELIALCVRERVE